MDRVADHDLSAHYINNAVLPILSNDDSGYMIICYNGGVKSIMHSNVSYCMDCFHSKQLTN